MNILYITWNKYQLSAIQNAFLSLGHNTVLFSNPPRNYRIDPRIKKEIVSIIGEQHIHFLFSSDFYPIIAEICHSLELPYISWCHECPAPALYSKTVLYPENHVCLFDSFLYQEMIELGVKHAYYVPLAFSKECNDTISSPRTVKSDLTFIGSLCNSSDIFQENVSKLSEKASGFLYGLISAQSIIYGQYILRQSLNPILTELKNKISFPLQPKGLDSYTQAFADYYLTKLVTQKERIMILSHIASSFKFQKPTYYITGNTRFTQLPFEYYTDIPFNTDMYKNSNIIINLTKRSVFSGIPKQIYNIWGNGNFVLSNFQNDFSLVFSDIDIPYFSDQEDLDNKIDYYLSHVQERKELTETIQNEILEHHTVFQRIQLILSMVFL